MKKLVATLFLGTMALASSATIVKWDFPRLGCCHEGLAFSDGMTGVLVWGGGDTINFTIGRGDLWDHRGGYVWKDSQSYTNIVALASRGNKEPLVDLFKKITPEGEPRNPRLLPFGRVVVKVAGGVSLKRGELDTSTGLGTLFFADGREVVLAMAKGGMTVRFAHGLDFSASAIPSLEQKKAYETLIKESHHLPEKWSAPDGSAGGFVWTLVNPTDPTGVIAWQKRGAELAIGTARGLDVEGSKQFASGLKDYATAKAESVKRWGDFWREGARIKVPDPIIQEIFDYGMYRFGAMTASDGYAAGLQGQWLEDDNTIPWNGDYHFNINVQECYSPAYRGGHFQHLMPLFRMMLSWRERLRDNARKFARIDNGYVLPHSVDDKGVCIGGFWTGTIDHASTAWMASLMYRYVRYSGDIEFLRKDAFDFMKGAMNVYLEMFEEYEGRLSLPIGPSPEWAAADPRKAIGRDSSFQLAAAHRLAKDLIDAASKLGEPADPRWLDVEKRLPKYTADDSGINLFVGQQLTESHRHHSHIAALYPFDTLDLDDAETRQVVNRSYWKWVKMGNGYWSGWCVPWASILHTHLGNSVAAVEALHNWQAFYTNPGHGSLHDSYYDGYTILNCRKTIMQMDGQCAAATAAMELMAHEINGKVEFFRGCPEKWREVSFENLALSDGRRVNGRRIDGVITIEEVK